MPKRVLVIAAHLDDDILGVGGTMARHIRKGDSVVVLNISDRAYDHQIDFAVCDEQRAQHLEAVAVLGVTSKVVYGGQHDERLDRSILDVYLPIEAAFCEYSPTVVYTHHHGDVNQDHRAVFEATMIASRAYSIPGLSELYCYEVLSSTEQAPNVRAFQPSCFVDITDTFDLKVKAMLLLEREVRPYPFPRSATGMEALARFRGLQGYMEFAEAFELIRMVRR